MTFLIPKHRELVRDIIAPVPRVSARFRMVARSARYKGDRVLADFHNMILNVGLQRLLTSGTASSLGHVHLGTGTGVVSATETSLQNYTSSISGGNGGAITSSYVDTSPRYSQVVKEYQGTVGGNTGTFYEIGIGATATGNLISRALILDGAGNPNPVTVLGDEQLFVFYTFRWYYPETDTTGVMTINGADYNWTARAAGTSIDQYAKLLLEKGMLGGRNTTNNSDRLYGASSVLGPLTGIPTGSYVSNDLARPTVHTAPNLYADTIATFPAPATPSGGVGAYLCRFFSDSIGLHGGIQMAFSPPIPKTATQTLTLTTRVGIDRYV